MKLLPKISRQIIPLNIIPVEKIYGCKTLVHTESNRYVFELRSEMVDSKWGETAQVVIMIFKIKIVQMFFVLLRICQLILVVIFNSCVKRKVFNEFC